MARRVVLAQQSSGTGALSWLQRSCLCALILLSTLVGPISPRQSVSSTLKKSSQGFSFSIVSWEAKTLLAQSTMLVRGGPATDVAQVGSRSSADAVTAHYALGQRIQSSRSQRDVLAADPTANVAVLREMDDEIQALQQRYDAQSAAVASIVSAQVEHVLADWGLQRRPRVAPTGEFGLPFVRIDPPVSFIYSRLPLNLVVAPRDRIAIVGSVLLTPDLSASERSRVEARAENGELSAYVTRIGGFGSYPSMVPDSDSLPHSLSVIAHEWAHHYLVFRPLGQAFFGSYEMRSVNETVADIVGSEIGGEVYRRFYLPSESQPRAAPTAAKAVQPPTRDFGTEMRRIRREVEAMLAKGDIPAAERHMESQRQELARHGIHVRKLNTAYLSFFGAYSGGSNPYEAGLRALRTRSSSLSAFLSEVSEFSSPSDVPRG